MGLMRNIERFRFLFLASLQLALTAVVAFSTMLDYAISWDEPYRWRSGDEKRLYYERLFQAEDIAEALASAPRDVYPGFYDIPLSVARKAWPEQGVLLSRIWTLFFGMLAVASVMGIVRKAMQMLRADGGDGELWKPNWLDDLAPVVAALALLCMPEFYGHMFMNPKDVPFAAMHALSVWLLLEVIAEFPRPRWGRCLFFGVSVGLAMGTRLPGVVVIAYFGLAAVLFAAGMTISQGRTVAIGALRGLALRGLAIGGVAMAAMLPWWPAAHGRLFTSQVAALGELQVRAQSLPLIFEGRIYEAGDAPFYYALSIFILKVPIWIHVLLLAGAIFAMIGLRHAGWKAFLYDRQRLALATLVFSFSFPFAYVLIRHPAIHDGFRHLMFLLPLAAASAGVAWRLLAERLSENRIGLPTLFAVTAACVALVFSYLVRLHPYQYVYYNELIGGPAGAYSRYQTEYWATAGKAGLGIVEEQLAGRQMEQPVKLLVTGPWHVLTPYLGTRFELTSVADEADFFLGNTEMRADALVDGREVGRVERMGLPILIVKQLSVLE